MICSTERRPKYITIIIYWKWSKVTQHCHKMPYEPYKMLNGRYRKLVKKLKEIFENDPIYNDERIKNGNKTRLLIQYSNI